ncbi:MAG: hypothetical protein QG602_954, partial [Verrucomicrobiota bacterium]|nr:hypothetical protein [Verrucomicrobiota bacterium]
LVAPIAPTATSRAVVLPPGRWYDFYTGRLAGGDTTITVTPETDRIPLFVRDGAIIPRLAGEPQRAPRPDERPALELWHYGEQPGALRLYDDDGETFAYERGDVSWTDLRAERGPDGTWRGTTVPVAGSQTWRFAGARWIFLSP